MNAQPEIPAVGIPLIVVVVAILLIALLLFWTLRRARSRANSGTEPGGSDRTAISALMPGAGTMVPSFSRGLRFLKEHVTGRDYLYDVPWLMMLGAEGAEGSDVLANAASSASLARHGGRNFGLPGGMEWWFYDRSLVLNPPPCTVLRRDGTSDRTGWLAMLQLLARRRARRPLDGVILAISVEELLEGEHSASRLGDPAIRADVIRQKLSQLRRAVSMRMPVYVLVTRCELIPGFGSFAAELPPAVHSDIFGWSNPYPLEEAFSPDWVDQCCDEMRSRLVEQQMEIFVERNSIAETDGVFLFPSQFNGLRTPLRQFLAQIFMETAYEESYYFRGIYFCGDAVARVAAAEPEPAMAVAAAAVSGGSASTDEPEVAETSLIPSSRPVSIFHASARDDGHRPIFLNHLFERKIFPECRLARPLKVIDMSRNRVVMWAKILTVLFTLLAGAGTLRAYLRFSDLTRTLVQVFPELDKDVRGMDFRRDRLIEEQIAGRSDRREKALRDANMVLRAMPKLARVRLRSVFIPASWNGTVDNDVKMALSKAFSSLALTGFRVNLSIAFGQLIRKTTPRPTGPAAIDSGAQPEAMGCGMRFPGTAYDSPASVPEYKAWNQYIAGLRELELNIGRYNHIASEGEGSAGDLQGLLKYLKLDTDWPSDFDFNNSYFVDMLRKAQDRRIEFRRTDPVANQDEAANHARQLVQAFFRNWFGPRNHLLVAADVMGCAISDFERAGSSVSYETLRGTADSIAQVTGDLNDPSFDWLSDGEFDPQRLPAFSQPTADLQFLQGYNLAEEVQSYGQAGYRSFTAALARHSSPLTPQMIDLDSVPVQVSGPVASLQTSLRSLLDQTFVSRDPGPRRELDPRLPMWDRNALMEAARLFDAYDKFDRGTLRAAPPRIRDAMRRVALARLQANVQDLVAQAQSPLLPGSAPGAELQSFSQSIDAFQLLLAGYRKFENTSALRSFGGALARQASSLLTTLEQQLEEKNLYSVRDQNFDWWEEGQKEPLSLLAYDVRSADDLKAYVDRETEQVTALAQQVEPLLRFQQAWGSDAAQKAAQDWSAIVQELKRHTEKAPGNSVTLLEDFIRTEMDKIAPDSSCQAQVRAPVGRSDYFLTIRSRLRRGALDRCRILSRRVYSTQIAEFFNQRLAGRFPFSAPSNQLDINVDPKAVAEFYAKFDQYGKVATENLKQNVQPGKSRDAALDFLARMAQIRPVFATYIAGIEKDPVPSFDFVVNFRVNQAWEVKGNEITDWGLDVGQQSFKYRGKEKSGKWRLGDPIRVSFRFADDSPLLPARDNSQPGMSVNGRMVSFTFDGAWSLFHLLQSHKPADNGSGAGMDAPHTLGFLIPTVPDRNLPQPPGSPVGGQVNVYLQLIVVPPGGKDSLYVPLPFPAAAPTLSEN